MHQLSVPTTSARSGLTSIVELYNALPDDAHVEKLFYLQQINFYFRQSPMTPELITWRNMHGKAGLEAHLQRYGIHRDSSPLLQSIEFAKAVHRYTPDTTVPSTSIFSAMRERDDLLRTRELTTDTRTAFIAKNKAILDSYLSSPALQEQVLRHLHFLSLSYGKLDAIQGEVSQRFPEYKTSVLGNPEGNNKNFIFKIAGESEKIVIRVEDRNDLGHELKLQTHAVSAYFSEDYATIMMPFVVDGETEYRPVVLSEFASQGDLSAYAKKLTGKTKDEVAGEAQLFFTKLSDFCIKLMDSGHYHPDIKLSNFLTDGTRIIVSDRKTITDSIAPKVSDISSSPLYAAPEYQACITVAGSMNHIAARRTTLDMPAYMSYQIGMALKQFMQGEHGVDDEDEFLEWKNIAQQTPSPTERIKNMGVLIQELTRANPKDRLPIAHFHTLLAEVNTLSNTDFMARLEELWPKSGLSTQMSLEVIEQILTADHLTNDLKEKLDTIAKTEDVSYLGRDPRANFSVLMAGKPLTHIKNYLAEIESALLAADTAKAIASGHGTTDIPRTTTIVELGAALPKMSDIAHTCFQLNKEFNQDEFPGLSSAEQTRLQELIRYMETTSAAASRAEVTAPVIPVVTPFWATTRGLEGTPEPATSGTMIVHDDEAESPTMVVHDDSTGSGTMVIHADDTSSTSMSSVDSPATGSDTSAFPSPSGSPVANSAASTQEIRGALAAVKARKPAKDIASTIGEGDAPAEPKSVTPGPGSSSR